MPVHVIALFRRRPDITHEQFMEYWGKNHADIITSLDAVKRKIVRYTQFHIFPQETAAFRASGASIAPYDGMAELIADSMEDFNEMATSEGYLKLGDPDKDNFIEKTSMTFLVVEAHVMYERDV